MLKNRAKLLALAAPFAALAACEEAPTVAEPAEVTPVNATATPDAMAVTSPEVTQAAQVLAAGLRQLRRQNFGTDVVIEDARAVDNRLEVDLRFSTTGVRFSEAPARAQLRQAVCSSDPFSAFVLIGGVVRHTIFSRTNERLGVVDVTSC